MVAVSGVIFLILSVSKLREKVAKEVPDALKIGIQAAVGTLIVFIGLRGAGFIVANPNTYVAMGSLASTPVLLTLAGILVTPVLVARRVPGALVLSIAAITVIGIFVPLKDDGTMRRGWVQQRPAPGRIYQVLPVTRNSASSRAVSKSTRS